MPDSRWPVCPLPARVRGLASWVRVGLACPFSCRLPRSGLGLQSVPAGRWVPRLPYYPTRTREKIKYQVHTRVCTLYVWHAETGSKYEVSSQTSYFILISPSGKYMYEV
eukprot:3369858-Prymnesium_polylepis.1